MATPLNQPPPTKQTNYLPWIIGGCAVLLIFWIVIVIAAFGIYYYTAPKTRGGRGGSSSGAVKLVDHHGIETIQKTWNSCTAYAPAHWTIVGNEQRVGMGIDLAAPDVSEGSSYGIVALPVAELYGQDVYSSATPEKFFQSLIEGTGGAAFQFDEGSRSIEGYTLRYWRAQMRGKPFRGFVLYQTFDSGVPGTYIVAYRTGAVEARKWDERKNVVYDVAASIRCTKHLYPAQESALREPKGSSKDEIEEELSIKREEATMGFQNVYSPSTGQHWEASYSDYNPTGPDGPGYYRRVGNSYEKLNEGFPPN